MWNSSYGFQKNPWKSLSKIHLTMTSVSRVFCLNTVQLPSSPISFEMFLNTRSSRINASGCTHAMDSGVALKCAWEQSWGEISSKCTLCPGDPWTSAGRWWLCWAELAGAWGSAWWWPTRAFHGEVQLLEGFIFLAHFLWLSPSTLLFLISFPVPALTTLPLPSL